MVKLTSPAALNAFGKVNDKGHTGIDAMQKHLNILTAIVYASGERLKHDAKNPANINNTALEL